MVQLKAKFPLGTVVATSGAQSVLGNIEIGTLLMRHSFGDWGDVCQESKAKNEHALLEGDRILSCYKSISGENVWIITEADHSVTTILLPDEY